MWTGDSKLDCQTGEGREGHFECPSQKDAVVTSEHQLGIILKAGEMAQWAKVLLGQACSLSLIPETHVNVQ
jgi:hypothetical protein